MTLGYRIKEIRTDNKMTQKEFAEVLSVSRPFISRVEADKETPSDSLLKLIAATFKIRLNWLKYGEGHKEDEIKRILKFLELQDGLFIEEYEEKHDFAKWSSIMLRILRKIEIKDNSEQYYRNCITSILSTLDHFFTCCNDNNYEKDLMKSSINYIEQRMIDATEAFKEENLDSLDDV